MKPYPSCQKCGKRPDVHGLIRGTLACTWEPSKSGKGLVVTQEGYFGPATALVVADLYRTLNPKKELPTKLLDQVLSLKKAGITSW